MDTILTFDNVMPDPVAYRANALRNGFKTIDFGKNEIFHGIGLAGTNLTLPEWITARFPSLEPRVNFFRKSPIGQKEPTFIHSDDGMGDWTAILYLNEKPIVGDGTKFWKHKASGKIKALQSEMDEFRDDLADVDKWEPWHHVRAAFNRLLMFPSPYFHSRAIFENYGVAEDARLIQVVFGNGRLS